MSGTIQRRAETALTERYEALLRLSQTLLSIRSSEELFRLLARELRAVVNFYVMGIGIFDEKTHEIRLTSYGEPGDPLQVPKLDTEETFTWWVYQHQQSLVIPSLDTETRFPAVVEMLKNRGVRSVCALPLTTVHQRLGGLAIGSTETAAYSSDEVKFLSLVANQVALAVDDALNFDASRHAKEDLRASEESLRLIVDSIPGLVITMTAEGRLEFVSQQGLDYSGRTIEELKAWTTSDIIYPDEVSDLLARWRHSIETGHPARYDTEYRIRRADGVYRWFQVRALPMPDEYGRITRWYCLHTDIDERKQAEDGLHLALLIQFNNAVKPLLVFAAAPYGMIGALIALAIMHTPFGFMAFLGVASLIGVIVSHVIVLFDFIEEMHEKGEPLERALPGAGIERIRPVMITVAQRFLPCFLSPSKADRSGNRSVTRRSADSRLLPLLLCS